MDLVQVHHVESVAIYVYLLIFYTFLVTAGCNSSYVHETNVYCHESRSQSIQTVLL